MHSVATQCALPETAISSDQDQKQAISVRQALFRRAADSSVLIGGMHMPFPDIGHIRFEGEKGYARAPIEFSPIHSGHFDEKPASAIQSMHSICLRVILS